MRFLLNFLTFTTSIFAVNGFAPSLASNTRLNLKLSATDSNNEPMTRRDVAIKSAAIAATGVLAGLSANVQGAIAEDGAEGRLIEFTVENLGGEEGQTGKVVMKLRKDWAPIGAERFEKLTEVGFWNEARSFRVLPGFIVQFGINGDPATQALWRKPIGDDAVKVSNKRGTVTFATAGANTRTTQIFFNTGNNGKFYLEEEALQLQCLDSLICSFFYFSVP
jgi:cyclophilin family peptidyl-prolyl cis-trans isomerase